MAGSAKIESHYKRLQRFFKGFEFSFAALLGFVRELFGLPEQLILTLDRTNWLFGKKNINFLTLGIAYKCVAFPILWTLLDKKGNSDETERIHRIRRLLSWSTLKARNLTLLMDREFIGKRWLADKILAAREWDGLHGVITNIKEDSPGSIIARYARLWKIEESFRINKHNLQMRPIFHYKPERIQAQSI